MEFVAQRNWELLMRHPWIHEVPAARSALGPNITLKYEAELRPLDGVGLTDVEMDSTLTLISTHVLATARAASEHLRTQRESGMTDAEWWLTTGPALAQYMGAMAARFPVAGRVGTAAGEQHQAAISSEHALKFGLDRILSGVALLIEERKN
jgi:hypothetical protein